MPSSARAQSRDASHVGEHGAMFDGGVALDADSPSVDDDAVEVDDEAADADAVALALNAMHAEVEIVTAARSATNGTAK